MRLIRIAHLSLLLVASACGQEPGRAGRTNGAQTPSAAGTKPNPGPDGEPRDCPILFDDLCYPTQEAACAAAACPIERCSIRETYPGKLSCMPAAEGER